MPPIALLIIQGIQLAIKEAPQAIELVNKGKEFISALMGAKVITVEQQRDLHDHIDKVSEAALNGDVPPAWGVEADPV